MHRRYTIIIQYISPEAIQDMIMWTTGRGSIKYIGINKTELNFYYNEKEYKEIVKRDGSVFYCKDRNDNIDKINKDEIVQLCGYKDIPDEITKRIYDEPQPNSSN